MPDIQPDVTLDCKGLSCPMPVLKAKKAIDAMKTGQVLRVVATDPGSKADIPALLRRTGNELIETKEEGNTFIFLIKKTV
ncbi:MAG: sulfurtransferase TusA family protein [Nitrospirae bacterium]|nr:sulfurtransferase TusA family protein [Nitrospirota bacterium]